MITGKKALERLTGNGGLKLPPGFKVPSGIKLPSGVKLPSGAKLPDVPVTRRQLLGAASVAGMLSLAASAAPHRSQQTQPHQAVATTTPRPSAPPPPPPASKPVVHPLAKPVYTLEQFRKATGGPAFPAHAVALTIDDGPHPLWTPKILKLLRKHHVPATFCMIGNQVLGHETVAKDVLRDGHHVANHTWSHPTHLAKRKSDLVNRELTRAQEKIHDTTGATPTVFRSPGGDWSPTVLRSAAEHKLIPLDWSDDPRDWSRPGIAAITNRLLAAHPGQILLCHDGGGDRSQTYQALSTVLPALKARGYTFVALSGKG